MGIGVVVIADGQRREHGEYLGVGTNNIAELVAIERGVEMASVLDAAPLRRAESVAGESGAPPRVPGSDVRPVHVHTDSGYAIGVLSKGWRAKANQTLIERVRKLLAARPGVKLVKVPGHAGVPENERCDALARAAIARRGVV
jgi:ribonuclease HI